MFRVVCVGPSMYACTRLFGPVDSLDFFRREGSDWMDVVLGALFFLSFPGRALGEGIVPAAGVGVCMWGFFGGLFQDKLGYGESFYFFPFHV